MDDVSLHKEIDLIQGCINRMANNSFMLKGWSISLVAVILALTDDRFNPLFLLFCVFVPLLCFWYIDAFFLRTEKMYRRMYEWVLKERKEGNTEYQYDLNPLRFCNEVESYCKVMFSTTLKVFYGIPTLVVLLVIIYRLKDLLCSCLCGC